jgi:major membrane immunogen (membrane-anchored lipoprotein)
MKKVNQLFIILSVFLMACGGVKKTENAISSGNYDQAFNNAVTRLNKDKIKNAKQIPLLKQAYDKANERDLAEINLLKNKTDARSLELLYKKYVQLDVRQDEIILLEPLSYDGKTYNFSTKDYTSNIATSKNKFSDQLYNSALPLMNNSKENSRKAFAILEEIQVINPNYRTDLNAKILQAKAKGMDYVFVVIHNNVASQLQDSTSLSVLENFANVRTGDFNNKWVEMHNIKKTNTIYNYQADVFLDRITAIPEKTNSQTVEQEKDVQTGWNYQVDADGNRVKDAEGNDIRTPKVEKITATVLLYQQIKSTTLDGKVVFKNLKTGAIVNTTPIDSEAKLENVYGTYQGDPKAIDQKYHEALQKKKAQFPEDSAFNKFALQNFKQKFEQLLSQQKY